MRPIAAAAGQAHIRGEFSPEVIGELLRALRARAADHPESPGLIASWPGVPEARMTAACAQLRRQGHAVHQVSIAGDKARTGWAVGGTTYRAIVTPAPPAALAHEDAVLVREVALPNAVSRARTVLTTFAERGGAPETVRTAVALAVTEACKNVVMHAYVDRDAPGDLEVRACIADAVLVVEVADDGRGMMPRVDGPGRGLGLPLIAQLSDAFEILRRPERPGMVVRMNFDLVVRA
jgi:anti-sigma regulatory factor (Ser/Thr protein kinase)